MANEKARMRKRMEAFEALGDQLKQAEAAGDDRLAGAIAGRANATFTEELYYQLLQAHLVLQRHRRRLSVTYGIYVTLAIAVFVAGLALLASPFVALLAKRPLDGWTLAFSAVGGTQVVMLLVFSPFTRLVRMMADMTQLLLIIEGHLLQVGLRLIEFDPATPASVGAAAIALQQATADTTRLIQLHLEDAKADDLAAQVAATRQRLLGSADPKVRAIADLLPVGKLVPAAGGLVRDAANAAGGAAANLARDARAATGAAGRPKGKPTDL
ncbi:MAG TPA: hypothetical protein VM241_09490 [Candidatus Thermoplasmatota archaeon]|nr:hypothetical protein [Candidatus Thermoplasmatota archaeon]